MTSALGLLLGAALPRVEIRPPTSGESFGPEAVELAALAGLQLEDWQVSGLELMLSTRADGRWACREYGEMVGRQQGKALDASTPVLTTSGWATMGGLGVGDEVFHPDGHPARVVGVSGEMRDRRCFRVTTTDGRSVIADAEHLWTVQDVRRTRTAESWAAGRCVVGPDGAHRPSVRTWETLTTTQLVERGVMRFDRPRKGGGRQREFAYRLPVQQGLVSKPVDLPIDPYLFGAWLGDGCSTSAGLTVGDQDLDEVAQFVEDAGARVVSTFRDRTAWRVRFNINGGRHDGFESRCRRLGVWGNKYIPDVYLAAGAEQRLALLQGLMDTDGSIYPTGVGAAGSVRAEFCSTNPALAEGVLYLARSLGWRATSKESAAMLNGREVGRRWRVCWTPQQGEVPPFRLQRKAKRVQAAASRGGERHAVSIATIEPVESRPVCCIKVERPDGQFLAGRDLIATHNTTGLGAPRALAGLLLLGERLVMWSAHEYKTSIEAFLRVRDAFRTLGEPAGQNQIALDDGRLIVKMNNTNGEEGFELSTGQRLRFIARSKGSGRGFTGDCNIIDEAYAYTRQQQSAIAPTMLARPFAQTVYLSSPPLNGLSGEVLFALRDRAERGDDRLGWRDWGLSVSLDEVAEMSPRDRAAFLDDRRNWAATQPALGRGRVTEEAVDQLRRELDDLDFAREVLGCWPKRAVIRGDVIDPDLWRESADQASRPGEALVLAVDASPGGRSAAIASSGRREDGRLHVKVVDYRPGTGWVTDRMVELRDRWQPRKVLLDPAGPGGALLADLLTAGVEVEFVSGREMAQACGALVNDLKEDRIRHCNQNALNDAVAQATSRRAADAWAWDRKDTTADICPLVAATLAAHGFRLYGAEKTPATPAFAFVDL